MKKEKTRHYYLDNDKFLEALSEYKKAIKVAKKEGKSKPPIPEYIGECFLLIAQNTAKRGNFSGYTYNDEMVSDGVENCLMYFENFDPKKSKNAFGYFGFIIWRAFLRRIYKEKREQYVKYKLVERSSTMNSTEEAKISSNDNSTTQVAIYDNLSEFIHEFEKNVEEKKAQVKANKKKKLTNKK